ncbi:hypothetical protein LWI29_008743 [Acer saccharum]|uniref:Uncharacterized protein n=1 Tax=Acer saccharum TaxID=4024 RepID=A0AA39RKK8_ACESA|nr:hypothetical protein LWI29_008743 [Acer saccharum]
MFFSAIHNDLALSEDVAVPHSLVSNALVVSSDLVVSAIFSYFVSLTASCQVSSFLRSETILESSTTLGLIYDVHSIVPIQAVPVIDSLVQTVSTTMGPSQHPSIPYTTHMVRNDRYRSS